jgi:hypothetical protein
VDDESRGFPKAFPGSEAFPSSCTMLSKLSQCHIMISIGSLATAIGCIGSDQPDH